jgi:hypothetical protein
VSPETATTVVPLDDSQVPSRARSDPDGPPKRVITLYRTRYRDTVALAGQIWLPGGFSLIQRVSDTLNGRFAKKDAIR